MKSNKTTDINFWMTLLGLAFLLASALWNPANAVTKTAVEMPNGPVMLNEKVSVNGSIIHLGDLFKGVGDKAGIAVAYAPEPGKRAFFDANWLYRVAQNYQLPWKPMSLKQRTVVLRASTVIGTDEIKDHLLAALIEKGLDSDISIELSNRMLRLHVPDHGSASVAVEEITYNPSTQRFAANIIAPADAPDPKRTRVTGRIFRMLEVPVLNRRLGKGEVIRSRDIKWVDIRSKRVGRNIITDETDLIGMSSKRAMRMDTPIRRSEIGHPVLVNKGSLVIMTMSTPLMRLTSQGKAEENGIDGDTIRVLNTQSNKIVQAVVTGAGQVSVIPISHIAMNQTVN